LPAAVASCLVGIGVALQIEVGFGIGLLTTISTRRQEQGIVLIGALRGVFGFGSWARGALVKWDVLLEIYCD